MILIHCFARKLRDTNNDNPKNYPYWQEVYDKLKEKYHVVQVGVDGDKRIAHDFRRNTPIVNLIELIHTCDAFISVDSFFHHLAYREKKRGVVLFGQSDPEIFGYDFHINLLRDRKYLRPDQFGIWESPEYNAEAFVDPDIVVDAVNSLL